MNKTDRLTYIVSQLKRGDNRTIARSLGVTDVWVCYVFKGKGVSEPVLQAAEKLIQSRKSQSHETANN